VVNSAMCFQVINESSGLRSGLIGCMVHHIAWLVKSKIVADLCRGQLGVLESSLNSYGLN